MTDTPEVLSVREVVQALGVTQQTVYKLITEGRLKGFRVSNRWRVYRDSLNALISASAEDTAFVTVLREVFPEEDSLFRRVLELRFRDGLDRSAVGEKIAITEAKAHHLTVDALVALRHALRAGLVYDDVKDDEFALRVLSQLFLAQEE